MSPQDSPHPVARALLSVSDKTGLVEFARGLAERKIELVASGGTATALRQAGLEVLDVAELTGSPEMLGGRVKTLHPRVHGGVLARRELESDRADLEAQGVRPIDLVVVNLYPFGETVAREDVTPERARANIDIGGPCMVRAAAKNYLRVASVVDPGDYPQILQELEQSGGSLSLDTRFRLARKAFSYTAGYDTAIAAYLESCSAEQVRGSYSEVLS